MDLNKKYYSIDYDILLKEGTEEEQMMVLKENLDLACKFLLGSKIESVQNYALDKVNITENFEKLLSRVYYTDDKLSEAIAEKLAESGNSNFRVNKKLVDAFNKVYREIKKEQYLFEYPKRKIFVITNIIINSRLKYKGGLESKNVCNIIRRTKEILKNDPDLILNLWLNTVKNISKKDYKDMTNLYHDAVLLTEIMCHPLDILHLYNV